MATFKEILITNGGQIILDKLTTEEYEILDTSVSDFADDYGDMMLNCNEQGNPVRVLFIMDGDEGYSAFCFEKMFEGKLVADIIDNNLITDTHFKYKVITFNTNIDREFVDLVKADLMSDAEKEHSNFYLETEIIKL